MKKHIYTVHEGHRDYKCESCGKSFSETGSLKNHIHTVHEGHKDYKCECCDHFQCVLLKSFIIAVRNHKSYILNYHHPHKN